MYINTSNFNIVMCYLKLRIQGYYVRANQNNEYFYLNLKQKSPLMKIQ